MPLRRLLVGRVPARDFNALADLPLVKLDLSQTQVEELSFLRKLPLKELYLSGCKAARGYAVLSELKTLETLLLPSSVADLPEGDFKAIQKLRNHPSLRQIQIGILWGQHSSTLLPQKDFWERFDSDLKIFTAARSVNKGAPRMQRLGDRTWQVNFEDHRVVDLAPLKGIPISDLNLRNADVKDLTPLRGMPLRSLNLHGTNVADLSPLVGAELTTLDISGTNVADLKPLIKMPLTHLLVGNSRATDLMPLRGLPLRELGLNGCLPGVDLAPLANIRTLRELTLPEKVKNLEAIRELPHLRYLSYHFDEEHELPSQTVEEFWAANDSGIGQH
jgi:Leucine-rich repeat (LRR) protein